MKKGVSRKVRGLESKEGRTKKIPTSKGSASRPTGQKNSKPNSAGSGARIPPTAANPTSSQHEIDAGARDSRLIVNVTKQASGAEGGSKAIGHKKENGGSSSSKKSAPSRNGNLRHSSHKPRGTRRNDTGHAGWGGAQLRDGGSAPAGFTGRKSYLDASLWLDSPGSSRKVMDLVHDAVIIRDPSSRIVWWNASAAELYGYSADEATGKGIHSLLQTKFPSTMALPEQTLLKTGRWEGDLEHRRKDGSWITVSSRQSLLRHANGRPLLVKEINRDITQERRQMEWLRLLGEVSGAVSQAENMEEALHGILPAICMHAHWCAARACRANLETAKEIENTAIWFLKDDHRFGKFRNAIDAPPREGHQERFSECVLKSGKAVWIRDVSSEMNFAGLFDAARAGVQCAYGLTVPVGKTEGICIGLFSDAPVEVGEAFQGVMREVGEHLRRLAVRLEAEERQRKLSLSLMRAQDDERRRIARDLHDSIGQYLSALTLTINAARSQPEKLPVGALRKLKDAQEMIQQCSAELRTISHLLHPPLLEELGLASAAHWYIDGFGERSGIQVSAKIPEKLPRFDHGAELTVFRVLQECLTNIHRHSGSKTAFVKIECETGEESTAAGRLHLEVRDEGRGIPRATLSGWFGNRERGGVGISGMRERVKDLGGTLEIDSNAAGTTVRVMIPFRAEASGNGEGGSVRAVEGRAARAAEAGSGQGSAAPNVSAAAE